MMQTAESKISATKNDLVKKALSVLSADFESALASSLFNATWLMMVRIRIRLIFIDLTSEINVFGIELCGHSGPSVCAAE